MKTMRLTVLAMVCAMAGWGQTAAIEAAEKTWVKAVVGGDLGTLGKMLADDLIYAHASGVVDTKQSYIEKIKAKRQVYKSLEQRKMTVKMHGETAVTQCWARVTGVNPQGPFDDKIMMMHVWIKRGGQWVLAGHQTARVEKLPE